MRTGREVVRVHRGRFFSAPEENSMEQALREQGWEARWCWRARWGLRLRGIEKESAVVPAQRQAQESRLREKRWGRAVCGSPEVCELAGRVTYCRETVRDGNGTVPLRLMAL